MVTNDEFCLACKQAAVFLADKLKEAGYSKAEVSYALSLTGYLEGPRAYGDAKVFEDLHDGAFGNAGWPLVWKVCKTYGFEWGAGNPRNHQICFVESNLRKAGFLW